MNIADLPTELKPQAAPRTWERVLEFLPSAGRVLNAGAGRGGMSLLLASKGADVLNIDLHPEHFLAPNMKCEHCDLLQPLRFEDECFDSVVAVEVLEHLENPWQFFREAIRVLRDGGTFVFSSPNVETIAARWEMWRGKCFPYFREESFDGCYHVTPIFEWMIRRCCQTAQAELQGIKYSRVGWPDRRDVPRHYIPWSLKWIWRFLPENKCFGEITIYRVVKKKNKVPSILVGKHYR